MFQTSKSSSRVLRLPKQMALPGLGDIEFVSEQAAKVIGRLIELPFSLAQDSQDKEHDFILNGLMAVPDSEPVWSLAQIKGDGAKVLWQHATTDISLIHSLVQEASRNTAAPTAQ